jgi:hypothetical protein
MAVVEIKEIWAEYLRLIDELRKKAKATKAKVVAVLTTTSCEALANHRIMTKERAEDVRFDSYYLEKHELAKRKLVDRLKSALTEAKEEFQILTEQDEGFGRNDIVVIRNGRKLTVEGKNGEALPIEVKASVGLDLAQLERYLMSGERLLLVRVMTGQVKLLDPKDCQEYLNESIKDLLAKAQRILGGRGFLVSGSECSKCPLETCLYNKLTRRTERRFIHMTHEDFGEDLTRFMENLYPTIERAVGIILDELGVGTKLSLRVLNEQ